MIERIAGIITCLCYVGLGAFLCYVLPYHDTAGKVALLVVAILFILIVDIVREGIKEDLEALF